MYTNEPSTGVEHSICSMNKSRIWIWISLIQQYLLNIYYYIASILSQIFIHFFFFFLWLCCTAYGILVPQPGIKPMPPAEETAES